MIKVLVHSLILAFSVSTLALSAVESTPSTDVHKAEMDAAKLTDTPEELPLPVIPSSVKSEAEIPVQLDVAKKPESSSSFLLKAVLSFLMIGGMGIGAYFLVGKYRRANIGKSSAPQIKILTQHYLGPKKSLAIVRVAGESILVGITDHNISMIKALSLLDEDIPDVTPVDFNSVFNESTDTKSEIAQMKIKNNEDDEFSIAGLSDFVSSKLKNMRSLE